jgi:hypothetical protein
LLLKPYSVSMIPLPNVNAALLDLCARMITGYMKYS